MLDDINGIGPSCRMALMRTFKTIGAVRDADVEELKKAPQMTGAAAEAVHRFFHTETAAETENNSCDDKQEKM